MDDRQPTPDELLAIELGYALENLGPDTDRVVMVTLRLPGGKFVKDVWLSRKDAENLVDSSIAVGERQALAEAAEPLPLDGDVSDEDVTNVVAGFEQLLANGGE